MASKQASIAVGDEKGVYRAHPHRWPILILYTVASFMGALVWNILAPVYAIAEERFNVGPQAVNALANAYYSWYVPGSFLALWVMERYGLRTSLLWGYSSGLLSAVFATAGVLVPLSLPHMGYALLWLGTFVGSFGQPLYLNNVTCLALDWFPSHERDGAVTLTVVARSLGVMAISIAAPLAVSSPHQLAGLYVWQLPVWTAIAGAGAWVMARDRPPSPPSGAAASQWVDRDAASARPLPPGATRAGEAAAAVFSDQGQLFSNPNFVALAFNFSLLTGVGWTLLTVVGQLLEPCGYSPLVAGLANAVFMAGNALGCGLAAPLVASTRAYLPLQRAASIASLASLAAVLATAQPGAVWAVLSAWACLGLFLGPLTPIAFEHAVEVTFPTPPQASNAVLNVLGNAVGFVQTVAATPLLASSSASSACATPATPAAAFLFSTAAIGMICVSAMRPDYRRAVAEGRVPGAPPDRMPSPVGEDTPLLGQPQYR